MFDFITFSPKKNAIKSHMDEDFDDYVDLEDNNDGYINIPSFDSIDSSIFDNYIIVIEKYEVPILTRCNAGI